jgi:hypothetical protein
MLERIADNTGQAVVGVDIGWHRNTPTWRVLLPHGWSERQEGVRHRRSDRAKRRSV